MRVYYDRDADISRILDKKIAIVGYGSQGRAHALGERTRGALPRGAQRRKCRLSRRV